MGKGVFRRPWFPSPRNPRRYNNIRPPDGLPMRRASRPWRRVWGSAPNAPLAQRTWFPRGVRRILLALPPLPVPQTQLPRQSHRPWRWFYYQNGSQSETLRKWFPRPQHQRTPGISPVLPPQAQLPKPALRPLRPRRFVAASSPLNQRRWYPPQRKRYVIAPSPPAPQQKPVKQRRGWTFPRRRVKWMPHQHRKFFTRGAAGPTVVGPLQQVSQ